MIIGFKGIENAHECFSAFRYTESSGKERFGADFAPKRVVRLLRAGVVRYEGHDRCAARRDGCALEALGERRAVGVVSSVGAAE